MKALQSLKDSRGRRTGRGAWELCLQLLGFLPLCALKDHFVPVTLTSQWLDSWWPVLQKPTACLSPQRELYAADFALFLSYSRSLALAYVSFLHPLPDPILRLKPHPENKAKHTFCSCPLGSLAPGRGLRLLTSACLVNHICWFQNPTSHINTEVFRKRGMKQGPPGITLPALEIPGLEVSAS